MVQEELPVEKRGDKLNGILTTKQVAERLQVGVEAVKRYLRSGILKGFKPGGCKSGWRVKEQDLAEFINRASAGAGRSSRGKP